MNIPSRILIIEDEDILAENMRDFLVRREAEVRLAPSAEAGIEDAVCFRPDCVVVDYSLPGMNGLEAFSRLKQSDAAMRGILITGHPTDSLRGLASDIGIAYVLTKPFPFSELDLALRGQNVPPRPGEPGSGWREAPCRRSGERRDPGLAPTFPLGTATGLVIQDRRLGDRRGRPDAPLIEFQTFCIPAV